MLHARMLRYLDEVVRAGSIRQAAERLHVSASSINRQIIALEETLGTPIFDRLPRRLRLTAAGEILIAHVRETLKHYDRVQMRIEELRGIRGGLVRIAAMHGIAGGVLRPVIARFRRTHPGVTVTISAHVVDGIVAALLSGEADLGLAYRMPDTPSLVPTARFPTRMGAVVAPGHPLALRASARLSDCLDYPVVLADETMTINRLILDGFQRAGLRFQPDFLSNSVEFMKAMARSGEAVTFLSRLDVAEDQREGMLVFVPLQGQYIRRQELTLARRERGATDPAVALLEEDIRVSLRRLEDEDFGLAPPA
ncbi:LysR family transcriptional regulator [Prosthecomicrobium pneumaticum]|uniref:DNA-binding transcriptional LysR family regulator n=1 Tax=Prosthecomicrobium pneumaticum TaxID=81895 RepID=A0A7W9FLK3_9HYPH|nr:LysR family transcriptional regulator [Prosthecomicrobium pneumaticum]MBB5752912.1 DNA-binding transcriptional LysR family regulator [Prosthecomicrobium pneumaticum]